MGGYGELGFAFHDYGPNQNRAGGAQRDARLEFDTTRFVLELEGELPEEIEFEAEIEFEHGGSGVAQEVEYEEFGEVETEVEKGGEVLIEELHLQKTFADTLTLGLGRFYVAFGLLSRYYRPTDYLATTRSEAETTLLPAVWDEMGVQARLRLEWFRFTAQLVNGLDSTGFSSQRWIATGHQARFETVRATDLAVVGAAALELHEHGEVGLAAYYGGTSRNRPKPDLVQDCASPDPREVAPCGYVSAPLLLTEAHAQLRWAPVRGSAMVAWGRLDDAAAISRRNERLSNTLGVLRTPVAEEAYLAWAEVGVDVAPWLGAGPDHALEPFVRLDRYDTMYRVSAGTFDNPRFDRTVYTGGVAYTHADAVTLKLDASQRHFGTSALRPESTVRLAAGFVY
ncbi:MAG: hypothetical protein IT376_00580 [Polyangiaceae bacterium]|nr:hypothetical protein [Polyangiaceae bacterium]